MQAVFRQFGKPTGWVGRLAGTIMANRPSNVVRNERTVELLDVGPTHRVLEVGFGPGLTLANLAERSAHVVGVDHSEVMHRQARARNRLAVQEGRVQLVHGSIDEIDLPGTFDRICAVNVVMFWPDPVATLSRLRAALEPGGRIALTHQSRKPGSTSADSRAAAERIAADLAAAGFTGIELHEIEVQPRAYCATATV